MQNEECKMQNETVWYGLTSMIEIISGGNTFILHSAF